MQTEHYRDERRFHRIGMMLAACALAAAVGAAPGLARAQDQDRQDRREGDADAHLERARSPVWSRVERLAEEYREPWYVGMGSILSGGLLLWAGTDQLIGYYQGESASGTGFGVPLFGFFATLGGAGAVASGIHRMATSSPEADHARRLAESGVSERAGLLYLRHRAQAARRDRVRRGVTRIASSVGGATFLFLVPTDSESQRTQNIVVGSATAAIGTATGIYQLASRSLEEKLYDDAKAAAGVARSGVWRPAIRVGVFRSSDNLGASAAVGFRW